MPVHLGVQTNGPGVDVLTLQLSMLTIPRQRWIFNSADVDGKWQERSILSSLTAAVSIALSFSPWRVKNTEQTVRQYPVHCCPVHCYHARKVFAPPPQSRRLSRTRRKDQKVYHQSNSSCYRHQSSMAHGHRLCQTHWLCDSALVVEPFLEI